MIKDLRKKFILIAMGCVIVVLGAIMAIINVTNYISINQNAEETIAILAENGGMFPKRDNNGGNIGNVDRQFGNGNPQFSEETPFSTRFFTVVLNNEGQAYIINTGQIAAISTEEAGSYAEELYHKGSRDGYIDIYKYKAVDTTQGTMYIFLNREMELKSFYNFLFASLVTSLIGTVAVFILVFFTSKIVLKPVAESYEKQKRFITDASHEIKTPLTIIGASAEVIEMDTGESEWTNSIKNQVGRLSELTEKLVFLSRMDENRSDLQMLDFSISDTIKETAESFLPISEASHKGLTIQVEDHVTYCGSEENIRQMMNLLLDNAMKYTPEGGMVGVYMNKEGRQVKIDVMNTVIDMAAGNYNVLFERFYRQDSSRNSQTGGYGIGLSVVKAIVTAHKGKINCWCDGKDIHFTITL